VHPQARQWEEEEEEEEEDAAGPSVLRPVSAVSNPTAATTRLDALKARLEADRKKGSTLRVGQGDRCVHNPLTCPA
jgi:hypothetical protein